MKIWTVLGAFLLGSLVSTALGSSPIEGTWVGTFKNMPVTVKFIQSGDIVTGVVDLDHGGEWQLTGFQEAKSGIFIFESENNKFPRLTFLRFNKDGDLFGALRERNSVVGGDNIYRLRKKE